MSDVLEHQPEVGTEIPGEAAPAPAQEVSEVEARAKSMGWVDKDQYRGDPEKWRSAEEFVKRGEEELPILRERNRDLARKTAEMEARIARQEKEFSERVAKQERMAIMALRAQREDLETRYQIAKRNAVELGDTQRYDQLDRDHRQALQQFDDGLNKAVQPEPQHQPRHQPQGLPPELTAKVVAWTTQNPWFYSDAGLRQYAEDMHVRLQFEKPGLSADENLAEVAKAVRAAFPEKFGPTNGRPAAVEGGNGLRGASGRRERGWDDIPASDKQIAQQFLGAGASAKERAEFAKNYWSS